MYVASKYEEMYPPALEEFSFITDNTYESKHILRMEQILMKVNPFVDDMILQMNFSLDVKFFTFWTYVLYIHAILFNAFEIIQ